MARVVASPWLMTFVVTTWVVGAEHTQGKENFKGYLEWRRQGIWIVDGQQVALASSIEFKGQDDASSPESTPLGYEVEVEGKRDVNGVLRGTKVAAEQNKTSAIEREIREASDELEQAYQQSGRMFQVSADEKLVELGDLYENGPRWERARGIVDKVLPPYIPAAQVRVYVVNNPEWNAMALGNYSIYVFGGLIDNVDDDELALVLAHELAHASHEHARRAEQEKRSIAARAQMGGRPSQDTKLIFFELDAHDERAEARAKVRSYLMALSNRFSRELEDQADRVGLRYAYEAGYDVSKGPPLWHRFGARYGDAGSSHNFFLGSHPRWADRAEDLRQQLDWNYPKAP